MTDTNRTVPAEVEINAYGGMRTLAVHLDLDALTLNDDWEFDSVIDCDGLTLSLLFFPKLDDEELWEDELDEAVP
jgi:hypothetical protein